MITDRPVDFDTNLPGYKPEMRKEFDKVVPDLRDCLFAT